MYKTAGYKFDHFIVDNGSEDGTQLWLKSLDAHIILNPYNKGIEGSNQALNAIFSSDKKYDCICKVDNDCFFVTEGWLSAMVKIWEIDKKIILSPNVTHLRSGSVGRSKRIEIAGIQIGLTSHIGGIVHFMDSRDLKNFRFQSKNRYLHAVKDTIFTQHFRNKRKYRMGYMEDYFCQHYEGLGGKQNKRYPQYYERMMQEREQFLIYGSPKYKDYVKRIWGIDI